MLIPLSSLSILQRQLPSPLSLVGEGSLLPHQGWVPKAAAVRSRQGRGEKVKERRRGIEEGGSESCTFLQAEQVSPRRGPRPRSCLPSPGPPTRQQQHLPLRSPAAMEAAASHPEFSMLALKVCSEGTGMHRDLARLRHWFQMRNSNGLGILSILHNSMMVRVTFCRLVKGFI